ncbi:arylsulfatase [Andreprevotia lacus DSM 23236]|jgi:arylsulfatase|uniref:Arylsulfatase n=1 Tax=Andreprevotia lacus DSM 23236 TaxID=1121001 RepID=A0A1W1XSR1_9NEIS|nr:arylsulfatase [Andreprevotia lacus]SMC26568.1 arylsulfatase [Andreprevotia lacus DSM 23236]
MPVHGKLPGRFGKSALCIAIVAGLALAGCDSSDSSAANPTPTPSPSVADGRPNILYIMADDLGYSDIHAFGGEIDTPNLDALVADGRILTNHHTGTVSAITRSMLISGTDHHLVGEGTMGAPQDERKGLPGYEGYLNDSSLSVAQLLKDNGYHTYIAGKWHLGSSIVGGPATAGKTPDQWGFERSYTLLGGAASNHFGHEAAGSKNYTEDGRYVQPGQPGQPGGTGGSPAVFYSSDFYTDKLISYIDSNAKDGKPFFAYAAYTSPHWPLQVPEPWLSKYKGKYDQGYEPIAAARYARLQALGIIPAGQPASTGSPETLVRPTATPNNGTASAKYTSAVNAAADGFVDYGPGRVVKKWASLTADEKKAQARYMEIYAGMVSNLDWNIGRLIQHLKDTGQYDNTFILFQSDNGAEGWPIDSGADPLATDTANAQPGKYEKLGTDISYASLPGLAYGIRWGEVSATPFAQTKGHMGEGGISTPAIAKLPGQKTGLPPFSGFTHVTDNTATFLALGKVTLPTQAAAPKLDPATGKDLNSGKVVYNGRNVYPVTGKSLVDALKQNSSSAVRVVPFGEESYGRTAIYSADGRWKARFTEPPFGPLDGHWELFDLSVDRGETKDLSAQYPQLTSTLIQQWKSYMTSVGGVSPLRPRGYY